MSTNGSLYIKDKFLSSSSIKDMLYPLNYQTSFQMPINTANQSIK